MLRLSDAYVRRQSVTLLVQIMACRLFGAKPLSEPMLEYCQQHACQILIEIHTFSFTKIHLKMSSGKWRPICLCLNVSNIISVSFWRSDVLRAWTKPPVSAPLRVFAWQIHSDGCCWIRLFIVREVWGACAGTLEAGSGNFNTLRPRQNGRHFPDDIFKCISLNENT